MFAKQAQSFLKCSRIKFIQFWQTLQQSLLLENLVLLLNIGKTYLHEDKCYSIQEIFRRVLVVFLQSWMFLQPCEVFANFCANYFAKWTSVAKKFLQQKFLCKIICTKFANTSQDCKNIQDCRKNHQNPPRNLLDRIAFSSCNYVLPINQQKNWIFQQ